MKLYKTAKQIDEVQQGIAKHLNRIHRENPLPTSAICILNGGYQFFTNTIKYLAFDIKLEFIQAKSYEGMVQKSLAVEHFESLNAMDNDQRLLIFDDIIDSGTTANQIGKYLEQQFRPAEMIMCSLIRRKTTNVGDIKEIYSECLSGFEADDEWLIGYGMDNADGHNRQLTDLYVQ